jgi:hypothetical protein
MIGEVRLPSEAPRARGTQSRFVSELHYSIATSKIVAIQPTKTTVGTRLSRVSISMGYLLISGGILPLATPQRCELLHRVSSCVTARNCWGASERDSNCEAHDVAVQLRERPDRSRDV